MRFPNVDPLDPGFDYSDLITEEEELQLRGRDRSPKRTSLSLPSPKSHSPAITPSASAIQVRTFDSHHHLPPVTESIPDDPILFLPPLLSPLPAQHRHAHDLYHHSGPTDEELSNFNTRLPNIDPASLVLHQALHRFKPIDHNYASTSYEQAFNWDELTMARDIEREWYCVVFRSRRKPESSNLSLYQADREAHEEAVQNGGLVMYWYGVPDETGLNLATCIWQSRRHAVKAISGPKHMLAMMQAKDAYEVYELERWVLTKEPGQRYMSLSKWTGGDVGW